MIKRHIQVGGLVGVLLLSMTGFAGGQTPPADAGAPPVAADGGVRDGPTDIKEITINSEWLYTDILRLLGDTRSKYRVEASLAPGRGTRWGTIEIRGEQNSVAKAMESVKAALADESKRVLDLGVFLPPERDVKDGLKLLRMLGQKCQTQGWRVQVGMANSQTPDQVMLSLRGTREEVEMAQKFLTTTMADQDLWREEERRRLEASTVSLDFPGGTVEEFVNAVIGKFNFVPPIYQEDQFRELRVRPVNMKLVDLPSALSVLSRVPPLDAQGAPVPLKATFGDDGPNAWTRLNINDLNERLARSVMVIERKGASQQALTSTRRAAFALGETAPKKELLDATLDAIAVAINLNERSNTFSAKFHAPSNILIVQGTADELAVAGQIVKGKFQNARVELPHADPTPESPKPSAQP